MPQLKPAVVTSEAAGIATADPTLRRSPLSRLRIGSEFTTRKGGIYRIQAAVILVSASGAESPSVVAERIVTGRSTVTVLTVGMFCHQTRGAAHKPGVGARVDWAQVTRQPHDSIRGPGVLPSLVVGRGHEHQRAGD